MHSIPVSGGKQWTFNTTYFQRILHCFATAGDLIFGGDLEGNAFALDARTGQKLWSFSTGAPISSPPISFSVDGRQYVTISSGGGSASEGRFPLYYPQDANRLPQPASTLFVFAVR